MDFIHWFTSYWKNKVRKNRRWKKRVKKQEREATP